MEYNATGLLEDIQNVTDRFYQNQMNQGIRQLPDLTRKLSEFAEVLTSEQQREYFAALAGVMEAMEIKSYIMLADMLVFDVGKIIEEYQG